ncbi:MAG: glycosyltransferase [Arcobacter sp.]|nr:glycosyltransferase [Arcobacter sp.]
MFVKEPKQGFVKTRLSKTCGEDFTLNLYKCFVKDLICTLKNSNFDFKLCAYPNLKKVNDEFGNYNNFLQVKGDLGIKMKKSFEQQFDLGYEKIVLIGSDTPHISNDMIINSFLKLNENDIVLGPSIDGGYYLIAFNKNTFIPEVFNNISWSTNIVLNQTLQKLHRKNIYLLNHLNDIDIIEDLKDFYYEYKNSYFKDTHTINFLKKEESWKNLML